MQPNNPIEHVVIIVKENHTFDNYFGTFPGANGVTLPQAPDPINNSLRHDHATWLKRASKAVQQQYKESDIPAYWAYAQQYVLCDNYFSDVASESEPNHLFLIAADSPIIDNASTRRAFQPQPPFDLPSLPAALNAAGLDWRDYQVDSPSPEKSYFLAIKDLAASNSNVSSSADFDKDVGNNYLPAVSWLYAPTFQLSEHPPGAWKQGAPPRAPVVGPGMNWTVDRVNVIANSPLWTTTAIFITWDDYGGWYDHVDPPPRQSVWTGGGPRGYNNSQFRYGSRVPCLVVSPYARQGINSTFHSHVSLVKFCLRTFGLQPFGAPPPALDPGDPSDDMWGCFDFTAAPRLGVPSSVPV